MDPENLADSKSKHITHTCMYTPRHTVNISKQPETETKLDGFLMF